jgi:uncharacterized membrane protein
LYGKNQLTGTIPSTVAQLSSLESLWVIWEYLSAYELTSNVIVGFVVFCRELVVNNQLTGAISKHRGATVVAP